MSNDFMQDEALADLRKATSFEIEECPDVDLSNERQYKKLNLSSTDKASFNMFVNQIPALSSSASMANTYKVVFPEGLPHTLTALKQGGYGAMIKNVDGRFVGTASLYPMQLQAAVTGAFSIVSMAVGQYHLSEISSELNLIEMKMDKILGFLYGDKKAELVSEISFMRYAYNNYSSIMSHDHQRLATIASLQNTRKIAMKDVEFYKSDLDSTAKSEAKNYNAFKDIVEKVFQIKESLDMSLQLFVSSGLMEVFYSQNFDNEYINSVKDEILWFVEIYNTCILSTFNRLSGRNDEYGKTSGINKLSKVDTEALSNDISNLIKTFKTGEESPLRKLVISTLDFASKSSVYFIDKNKNIFVSAS